MKGVVYWDERSDPFNPGWAWSVRLPGDREKSGRAESVSEALDFIRQFAPKGAIVPVAVEGRRQPLRLRVRGHGRA